MFSKNKKESAIESDQHELLLHAQTRLKQKKRLYAHFSVFLIGSVFLIIMNKILGYGADYNWFVWAIAFWAFLFAIHAFNVFVTTKFMGLTWERGQREKLVLKQKQKIAELQKEIETDFPLSIINKKKE